MSIEFTQDDAYQFVRAGCVPATSTADWLMLPVAIRSMLAKAGRKIAAEDAIACAEAMSGPEGLAAVYGEIDGGDALDRLQLRRAAEEALADVSGGELVTP